MAQYLTTRTFKIKNISKYVYQQKIKQPEVLSLKFFSCTCDNTSFSVFSRKRKYAETHKPSNNIIFDVEKKTAYRMKLKTELVYYTLTSLSLDSGADTRQSQRFWQSAKGHGYCLMSIISKRPNFSPVCSCVNTALMCCSMLTHSILAVWLCILWEIKSL